MAASRTLDPIGGTCAPDRSWATPTPDPIRATQTPDPTTGAPTPDPTTGAPTSDPTTGAPTSDPVGAAEMPDRGRPAVVAVLAGGAGRRLGGAKAVTPLAGRPLISYPVSAAQLAGLQVLVLAKAHSELPELHCEVVCEPDLPRHPLCGIVAALQHTGLPVLAVACDMPFLPPALLASMAALPGAAVASRGGRSQPMLARWLPEQLPVLGEAMHAGAAMRDLVGHLCPRIVDERELSRFGEPELMCTSINDRAGLARAQARLSAY